MKTTFSSLPLSLAGVSLGIMLAAADYHVSPVVAIFLLLTAAMLHMKAFCPHGRMSSLLTVLAIVCGVALIYFSYGSIFLLESFILMIFGYMAIRAAGSRRYLVISGIFSVFGAYFVASHSFGSWLLLMPSVSILALNLCAADLLDDSHAPDKSKIFQTLMILLAFVSMTVYACLRLYDIWHFLYLLSLPLFVWYIALLWIHGCDKGKYHLNLLSLSSLVFALCGGFGFLSFLLLPL